MLSWKCPLLLKWYGLPVIHVTPALVWVLAIGLRTAPGHIRPPSVNISHFLTCKCHSEKIILVFGRVNYANLTWPFPMVSRCYVMPHMIGACRNNFCCTLFYFAGSSSEDDDESQAMSPLPNLKVDRAVPAVDRKPSPSAEEATEGSSDERPVLMTRHVGNRIESSTSSISCRSSDAASEAGSTSSRASMTSFESADVCNRSSGGSDE